MRVFNLEEQLTFYGTYHMDRTNVMIHMIFVPVIFLTSAVLLSNITFAIGALPFRVRIVWILSTMISNLYIFMDPVAGCLATPFVAGAAAFGDYLCRVYGADANKWAAILQVIAWISQFVGHGVYEKMAPALLDNIFQAMFVAPFFVFLEVLFMMGYRPELKARMEENTKKARKELEDEMAGKR